MGKFGNIFVVFMQSFQSYSKQVQYSAQYLKWGNLFELLFWGSWPKNQDSNSDFESFLCLHKRTESETWFNLNQSHQKPYNFCFVSKTRYQNVICDLFCHNLLCIAWFFLMPYTNYFKTSTNYKLPSSFQLCIIPLIKHLSGHPFGVEVL